MPIMNYTTTIAVSKTVGEINEHLARRGVSRISTVFDDDGAPSGIAFTMRTPHGPRDFELPVRTAGVLAALQGDKNVKPGQRTPEQAARVAWRIAQDWVKAVSALIDADLATLDEVMLPYMVTPTGETMFALYQSRQTAIEAPKTKRAGA